MNYYILESDGDFGVVFFGGPYSSEEEGRDAIKKYNRPGRFIFAEHMYVLKATPKDLEFTEVE